MLTALPLDQYLTGLSEQTALSAEHQMMAFGMGGLFKTDVSDIVMRYQGFVDPAAFGAKGDAIYYGDGITVSGAATLESVSHTFTAADVGKILYVDSLNERTVTAVNVDGNPRKVILSGAVASSSSGDHYWYMGTDDTAALRAALAYASGNWAGGLSGATTGASRNRNHGKLVVLRGGCIYLVGNTSAEYDGGAGTLAALSIPPRTGIISFGGVRNAMIMAR